jgi:hypothetical protein
VTLFIAIISENYNSDLERTGMNKFVVFGLLIVIGCGFQGKKTEFFDEQFKWKIVIPSGFEPMSDEQIRKNTNIGTNAISKTTGTEFENEGKIICIFHNDGGSSFTASYKSFDSETDGGLSELCQNTKDLICATYRTQFTGTKIDTSSSMETIDGLAFTVVKIIAHFPNRKILTQLFYERVFSDRLFSFNINFIDGKAGAEIIEAWKKSKFDRG